MTIGNYFGNLVQVTNLRDFFRTSIDEAVHQQGVSAQPSTVQYIVNLLTLFSRSEALFETDRDVYGIRPLALMLADAADTESHETRKLLLQRIGDVALFISGFFGDSLDDTAVDIDYYINIGGSAYGSLSDEMRGSTRAEALSPIYRELANRFATFVDVINHVRDGGEVSHSSIARVYEIWRKTGSERALAQLRQHGIEPFSGNGFHRRH